MHYFEVIMLIVIIFRYLEEMDLTQNIQLKN